MLDVSGVGQVKFERYGEAFLAVLREEGAARGEEPPPPGDVVRRERRSRSPRKNGQYGTAEETLVLAREGLSIKEMAERRGLATATIGAHLEKLIAAGELDDLGRWLDAEVLDGIVEAADGEPIDRLAPLKERMGDRVSYEELRLARAWLGRQRSDNEAPVTGR